MDENDMKRQLVETLADDFYIHPEISGYSLRRYRVRADFILEPKATLIEAGLPEFPIVVEVKGEKSECGGFPFQTFAQCTDYVDGFFFKPSQERAWSPFLGFVFSSALSAKNLADPAERSSFFDGALRAFRTQRVGVLQIPDHSHYLYGFYTCGGLHPWLRRSRFRGLIVAKNPTETGVKSGNRETMRESF